jgi:hypothetical protein
MDDFLSKPFPATELWAAMDRVVAARPSADHSVPSVLDPQVLLAACGGDAAILSTICSAFRACLPEHLAAIQEALRDRDAPRLRKAAHKMCGVVGAFSTLAAALASDLEDQAASGRLEESLPLSEQLEEMARELLRQVDGLSIETLRRQAGVAGDPNPLPHEVT